MDNIPSVGVVLLDKSSEPVTVGLAENHSKYFKIKTNLFLFINIGYNIKKKIRFNENLILCNIN